MKEKFRNIFWFFGIFAIVVMLFTFDMDYQELLQNLRKAGIWFPAVILLWVFIYFAELLFPGISLSVTASMQRFLSGKCIS